MSRQIALRKISCSTHYRRHVSDNPVSWHHDPKKLVEGIALGRATGNGGDLCPLATFFRLMDHYFEFHGIHLIFETLNDWDDQRDSTQMT